MPWRRRSTFPASTKSRAEIGPSVPRLPSAWESTSACLHNSGSISRTTTTLGLPKPEERAGESNLAAMVVTMRVDYRRFKHPAIVFSLMGLTTLLLISVFFLDRSHNTHRWIHWGGFSLQPSELAKPVLILFLAYFLEDRARSMDDW